VNNAPKLSLPGKAALIKAIVADRGLRASAVRVATALLFGFHNTNSGQCNPTYETIARASGLGRRAVINAVNGLKEAGWISTSGSGWSSNQFIFLSPEFTPQCIAVHPTSEQASTPECIAVHPSSEQAFTQNTGKELMKRNTGKEHMKRTREFVADATERDFDEWYAVYPRNVNRGQALKAYRAARKKTDRATLLAGAKQASERYADTEMEFIPMSVNWLNGERWLDEE